VEGFSSRFLVRTLPWLGALLALPSTGCRERTFHCESVGHDLDTATIRKDVPRQCGNHDKAECERVARALGGPLARPCFAQQRVHCFRYHSNGRYVFRCTPTAPECEKLHAEHRKDLGDDTLENCRLASPKDVQ
jgi:hypothetical protein